jgi:hypothetical protein
MVDESIRAENSLETAIKELLEETDIYLIDILNDIIIINICYYGVNNYVIYCACATEEFYNNSKYLLHWIDKNKLNDMDNWCRKMLDTFNL